MEVKLQYTKKQIMDIIKRRQQMRPQGPFDQPKDMLKLKKWQQFALWEWMEIGERLFACPEIKEQFDYSPRRAGKKAWIEED